MKTEKPFDDKRFRYISIAEEGILAVYSQDKLNGKQLLDKINHVFDLEVIDEVEWEQYLDYKQQLLEEDYRLTVSQYYDENVLEWDALIAGEY